MFPCNTWTYKSWKLKMFQLQAGAIRVCGAGPNNSLTMESYTFLEELLQRTAGEIFFREDQDPKRTECLDAIVRVKEISALEEMKRAGQDGA